MTAARAPSIATLGRPGVEFGVVEPARLWNWLQVAPCFIGESGVERKIVAGGVTIGLVLTENTVHDAAHSHPYDQWIHVVGGEVTVTCGGEVFKVEHGMALRIPANAVHSATFGPRSAVLLMGAGVDRP